MYLEQEKMGDVLYQLQGLETSIIQTEKDGRCSIWGLETSIIWTE